MSLIVAIKKDDVIYFGADTQTTTGVFKKNQVIEERYKVKKMPNGFMVGIVGTVYPSMTLRLHEEWFHLENDQTLTKAYVVKEIVNPLYKELERLGQLSEDSNKTKSFDFSFIIARQDKIFLVVPSGGVFEIAHYVAIGSGVVYVYNYLYQQPDEEPNHLIRSSMKLVSTYEGSVSAPFVYINTKDLIYHIEEE